MGQAPGRANAAGAAEWMGLLGLGRRLGGRVEQGQGGLGDRLAAQALRAGAQVLGGGLDAV